MSFYQKCLPHPKLTLSLIIIWLLLANDLSFGAVLMSIVLGVLIPLLVSSFWLRPPPMRKPVLMLRFCLRVGLDILTASFEVARLVLGSNRRLHPAFVEYPLELKDDFAISLLANTISLTPGTVSADISDDRCSLLVHGLDVQDDQQLIDFIKQRYERPLLEMFPCSTT